jgi:hypothetical protein
VIVRRDVKIQPVRTIRNVWKDGAVIAQLRGWTTSRNDATRVSTGLL